MARSSRNDKLENERIRHRITDMYADFVRQVDPRGYVMDRLIQRRIIDEEVAQQVRGKETRRECCRAMLHELLSSGNPRAFIELREALIESYNFIVTEIDKPATGYTTPAFDVQTTRPGDDDVDGSNQETEVRRLMSTNRSLNVFMDQLRADNKQLSSKLEELKQTLRKQQAELQRANQLNDELKAQLQTAETNNEDQQVIIETKDNRIASLNEQVDQAKNRIASMDEQLDQAKTIVEEFTKMSEQLGSKDSQLATANEKLRKMEESVSKLRAELESTQKEIRTKEGNTEQIRKSFDAKLADKEKKIVEVQTQNRELEASISELLKSKNFELEATNKKLQEVEETRNELEARLVDKDRKIAEVESKLDNLQTENEDLLSRLHDKEREIDELTFQDDEAAAAPYLVTSDQGDDGAEYDQLYADGDGNINASEPVYHDARPLKPIRTVYENLPEVPDTDIYSEFLDQEPQHEETTQQAADQRLPTESPASQRGLPPVARARKGRAAALKSQPVFMVTIPDKGAACVVGLAILDGLLYVVCKKSPNVFVYNTKDPRQPLPQPSVKLPSRRSSARRLFPGVGKPATSPSDIAACPVNHCVYVGLINDENGLIVAIQLRERDTSDMYRCWSSDGQPCGISMTTNNNVLVCYSQLRRLSEYSPSGKLIHRINLPAAIEHPWRAVALDSRVWIVSHGAPRTSSGTHRVCLIDGQLKQMTHCHGAAPGSQVEQLSEPRSVVVDAGQRVWVADCCNHRVKVLGVDLGNAQELLNVENKLSSPTSLCLDHREGLLYVGQHNGKILVFRVLQEEP